MYTFLLFATALIRFLTSGPYLPVSDTLELPLEVTEVSHATLKVYAAYENNIALYGIKSYLDEDRMRLLGSYPVSFKREGNQMLNLKPYLPRGSRGLYYLAFEWPEMDYWQRWDARRVVAVTDLGVSAIVDAKVERRAYVSVCRLSDGAPVPRAEVTVLTHANQVAAIGRTDDQGAVRLPFKASYDEVSDRPVGVLVKKDGDISWLPIGEESQGVPQAIRPVVFLFGARDIVKPGETFTMSILARTAPKAGLEPLVKAPLELELVNPDGAAVARQRVMTDALGHARFDWTVPEDADTGSWKVRARLAGERLAEMRLRIAVFEPDRIRLTVTGGAASYRALAARDTLRVSADYFFGERVSEARCKVVREVSRGRNPQHWRTWTVGSEVQPAFEDAVLFRGDLTNGCAVVAYPGLDTTEPVYNPLTVTFSAEVTPAEGRTASRALRVPLFAADRYIGVREAASNTLGRTSFDFALLAPEPQEAIAASAPTKLSVRLVQHAWRYHYELRDERIVTCWAEELEAAPQLDRTLEVPAGTALQDWRGTLAYADTEIPSGRWELIVTDAAHQAETHLMFWHWCGEVSTRSGSPAAIQLLASDEKVAPGAETTLSFVSPVKGRLYVGAGWRGVEQSFNLPVTPGPNAFKLRVPADAQGARYYVSATLIAETEGPLKRLVAEGAIRIDQAAHQLKSVIEAPAVTRPGAPLQVKVKLASPAPGAAVQLLACDEGVLALTRFVSPDPFAAFYGFDFGRPFARDDYYDDLYEAVRILPNGTIGGDGVNLAALLKRDSKLKTRPTVALLTAPVPVNEEGEAVFTLDVPDYFTGELRLMAVAWSAAGAGAATRAVTVRDVITAELGAPRFAAPGDAFAITATLFDHDLPEGPWEATLRLGTRAQRFSGVFAPHDHKTIALRAESTDTEHRAVLKAEVAFTMGGRTVTATECVKLRSVYPPVQEVTYLVTNRNAAVATDAPGWAKGTYVSVKRYGTPAASLVGALDWLESYPYGCLEQTTAQAFPFLAVESLIKLGLYKGTVSNAVKRIETAYATLLAMRHANGAFSMWPDGEDTWKAGSLFAHHFIAEAQHRGYLPAATGLDETSWLRSVANNLATNHLEEAAYASYILAIRGDAHFLAPARALVKTRAAFLAAAALVRGGYAAEGQAALERAVRDRARTVTSPRDLALTLYIGAEAGVDLDTLKPLVVKLNAQLRTDGKAWGTTQNNAWAALGLATIGVKLPAEDLDFVRIVRTGHRLAPPPVAEGPISVTRGYFDEQGRRVTQAKKGDRLTVKFTLDTPRAIERAVVCDLLPGGLELENLFDSAAHGDRWLYFGALEKGAAEGSYTVRAVTPGVFAQPMLTVEDMYDPDLQGTYRPVERFTVSE